LSLPAVDCWSLPTVDCLSFPRPTINWGNDLQSTGGK
jgi:hypothetical protein